MASSSVTVEGAGSGAGCTGAAGGVGLAAVELGKRMGLRVIAAASSQAKREAARSRGADEVVDYTAEGFRDRIKALTGGRGVDIVYDPVGGEISETALRSLGWRGRHLIVGFAAGEIQKLPANLLLLKGSALVGVFWGDFVRREPEANAANTRQLLAWLREGALRGVSAIAASASLQTDGVKASAVVARVAQRLIEKHLEETLLLNINFPPGDRWKVRPTELGSRVYQDGVHFRNDPRGGEYLWIGSGGVRHSGTEHSDTDAFDRGVVGVTPLSLQLWATQQQGLAAELVGSLGD